MQRKRVLHCQPSRMKGEKAVSAAFRNTRGITSREEEESCEHEHKHKQDIGQEQKFRCEVWKYFLAFITERTWWSPRRMDMHTQKFTYFWQSIWIFYDRIMQYSSQEKDFVKLFSHGSVKWLTSAIKEHWAWNWYHYKKKKKRKKSAHTTAADSWQTWKLSHI